MQIFFPKEEDHEIRATILPEVAQKFTDLGIEVLIEDQLVFLSELGELSGQAAVNIKKRLSK